MSRRILNTTNTSTAAVIHPINKAQPQPQIKQQEKIMKLTPSTSTTTTTTTSTIPLNTTPSKIIAKFKPQPTAIKIHLEKSMQETHRVLTTLLKHNYEENTKVINEFKNLSPLIIDKHSTYIKECLYDQYIQAKLLIETMEKINNNLCKLTNQIQVNNTTTTSLLPDIPPPTTTIITNLTSPTHFENKPSTPKLIDTPISPNPENQEEFIDNIAPIDSYIE